MTNSVEKHKYDKMSKKEAIRLIDLFNAQSVLNENSTLAELKTWLDANSKKDYCPGCFSFKI